MSLPQPTARVRGPRLQVSTGTTNENEQVFTSPRISVELAEPSPKRERLSSIPIPKLMASLSPQAEKPRTSLSHFQPTSRKSTNRALNESRKLLAHLLGQLQSRPMPPPVFDIFRTNVEDSGGRVFGDLMETVKGAVKFKGGKSEAKSFSTTIPAAEDHEDEDEIGYIFSTDVTFDLMLQLKDVLIIAVAQGWQIFHDSDMALDDADTREHTGKPSSPFRRTRQSLQPSGRRSRSPSPIPGGQVHAPQLLSQCISVLASVVSEDCRFKTSYPRPFRPPNSLQALTLDVAQFILQTQRHDPKIVSQIGFALIPAFATFPAEMHTRLLTFFEDGIIRGVLEGLRDIQGAGAVELLSRPKKDMTPETDAEEFESPIVSIQVEAAQDDKRVGLDGHPEWAPWSSLSSADIVNLLPTNAPFQPLSVYYLASLITPLLAAVLETVDVVARPESRLETLQRVYQLLNLIVRTKADAYLDCLEVIAYHSSTARHAAVSMLATFWPKALGHVVVSKPLPIFSYVDSAIIGSNTQRHRDHPYAHQFVPWRFMRSSNRPSLEGLSQHECRSCLRPIEDFGLLCPFCMSAVHFDCYDYPEGSQLSQYATGSDSDTQKVAMHRFCLILPGRRDAEPKVIKRGRHTFRLVNLFGLSLCFICRKPLWGCVTQGFKCTSCPHFGHPSCLLNTSSTDFPDCGSTNIDLIHVSIDWSVLRSTFVAFYKDTVILEEHISTRAYEEISVFYSVLWIQLQLMNKGVASGSIIIEQKQAMTKRAKENIIDDFELQYLVSLYEAYLSSGRLRVSPVTDEYLQDNGLSAANHSIMFDWSNLVYITSVIKTPYEIQRLSVDTSSDLLNVTQPEVLSGQAERSSHPFEVVSLAHMRDAIGYEFHIYSDPAARLILSHLHHLGFFDRLDEEPILLEGEDHAQIHCTFPLPLGLDVSTCVETMVSAVEACLSDLDLSVNEAGFLLLVRKLWPNGMATEFAVRRLTRNVIYWVLAEDNNLAVILRDYLAKQQVLPGVRSGAESLPWPSTQSSRPTASSANNGGDYVASRRALLTVYAAQWLLALHDQDPAIYTKLLYELTAEIARDVVVTDVLFLGEKSVGAEMKQKVEYYDRILRFIVKLSQTSMVFSVFDDLFLRWLECVSDANVYQEPMLSLHRLFPRDGDLLQRSSTFAEAQGSNDGTGLKAFDPSRIIINVASESKDGLSRSLPWLCVFSRSGIDIPVQTFMQFSSLATRFEASLADSLLLVGAAVSSIWLKSMGRQQLQTIFTSLHSRLAPQVLFSLQTKKGFPDAYRFIRHSLAACLLLYGCERNILLSLEMITEDEIKDLPSRRKFNSRTSAILDPIIIDAEFMTALESYVNVNVNEVSCLIAKFFNLFVTDSNFLEPYEVDNFVLRNGRAVCACAWQFYDIQRHDISSIRTTFLLRVLVVDSQPFQAILNEWFRPSGNWELRLLAITRLFRIVLDVTSPAFSVEGRQWRSSVTDVFIRYFTAMWEDEKEEIRLAVETWSQTLLPAHFEAISLCWNEALAKAPIPERIKLISFLIQLRPHFPNWRVLSWESIIETLLEDEYAKEIGGNEDGPASAHLAMYGLSSTDDEGGREVHADPDMALLRVSIILLSLQMIADGISIDTFSLLKIKLHLVQVLGFQNVSHSPAPNGYTFHVHIGEPDRIAETAFPCVDQLLTVLDAHHPFQLAPSAMDSPYADDDTRPLLVGTIFVDVSLVMFCAVKDILSLPVLTVKSMLESLMVIIYKHDFESRTLKHLQKPLRNAVQRALELLLQDISYELRQLALSVIQACTKRWSGLMSILVYDCVEGVAKLLSSHNHHGQDALIFQARSYLDTTLTMFNGLFNALCKRQLDHSFFVVVKQIMDANSRTVSPPTESLRDALLRDTLARAAENDSASFQIVMNNLQTYVEVVHHEGYSPDLMQFVGLTLTAIARRTSDWTADAFDPAPLLLMASTIIQHNKAHSRELLLYAETVLRATLVRFHVNTISISRVLQVTSTLYRKNAAQSGAVNGQAPSNSIASVVLEVLADGLRMKARVLPSTLVSMLEAITPTDLAGSAIPAVSVDSYISLADNGIHFLQNHTWSDIYSEDDFSASIAVAKLILLAASRDDSSLFRLLTNQGAERYSRPVLDVRSWNILVLTALSNPSETWCSILFAQLSTFSLAHHNSLRFYVQLGTSIPESATTDVNHAFIAIKLWIMLARKITTGTSPPSEMIPWNVEIGVWNELWPIFESLMNVFEMEAQAGNTSTLTTLTWSSVADLFLFLHQMRTSLALEGSSQTVILNRLCSLSRGDIATNKLSRTLRSISEPPPEMPLEVLVRQAAKEIVAAEKIQALELKRKKDLAKAVERKGAPDRNKRDMRVIT